MSPMRSIVRMAMQQLVSLNAEEWAGDPSNEEESVSDGTNQPDK